MAKADGRNGMPQITLLSQETIDKIAAGEVVERPSSVVKELVENAIDARATAVTVEIKEGGTTFVRITDNGCGIEREQVPLAFLRHSTSKIKSVEDLLCIHSLGFRGEALSSIAAVSQVELITKTYSDLTGTRYVIEGSREMSNDEIGAPDGTTFIVRNLFYNTPARKKFLKTAQTEGNYISDLMERLALSHPDVSFKFISNGQTKMHTSGNSNEKDLIYHIYGRDITAALLPVCAETEYFSVKGFVGKPMISRGNRSYESYFINGRYIKSALLSKAVEEAYKGFMMQHQYPFCVLYFTMDTELLDVNVHPTKMELRFSNNEEVYRKLYQTIRDVLTHKEFIPAVPVEEKKEEKKDEKAVKAAVSPLVQQYLDLKKKHPDAILLFRCGDFYETYKDDAVKASKILGITLTKSNGRKDDEGKPLAMAGFPYHALDTYLPKLIRAGERVAICDQLEMPKQTTSSKRGITEMVSPGKETGKQMAQESQETEQHTSLRR